MTDKTFVSLREYARHKKVNLYSVQVAIKTGRLKKSVKKINGKQKINPIAADIEWQANTHTKYYTTEKKAKIMGKRKSAEKAVEDLAADDAGNAAGNEFTAARLMREAYAAKKLKQEFEKEEGLLLDAAEVKRAVFKMCRAFRDAALSIPDRMSGELAGLTDPAVIHKKLTEEYANAIGNLAIWNGQKTAD